MNRVLRSRWGRSASIAAVVVAGMMAALLGGGRPALAADDKRPSEGQAERSLGPALAELSNAFRRAAEAVQPAVVSVSTRQTRVVLVPPREGDSELDERFRNWLRRHGLDPDGPSEERRHPEITGIGSGMIVDAAAGLVLTNHHVVEGAEEIRVQLRDGRVFVAKLVSSDEISDLAVVRIKAEGLREVVFGDSDEVQVGDFVLAFGSPLGFPQTITHGIVSAVGRSGTNVPGYYQNFIQTDAAINQGNSGGPLVNLRGEVIGMNTAIATRTGFDAGIGFAIPALRIKTLLPRLKSGERIERGYLGVVMEDVHGVRDRASELGWDEDRGVIVDRVHPDTPAEKAGLRAADIIIDINGHELRTGADLADRIAATEPGTTIRVGVLRDGKRQTVRVTVDRQPDDFLDLARRGLRPPGEDEAPPQDEMKEER